MLDLFKSAFTKRTSKIVADTTFRYYKFSEYYDQDCGYIQCNSAVKEIII